LERMNYIGTGAHYHINLLVLIVFITTNRQRHYAIHYPITMTITVSILFYLYV